MNDLVTVPKSINSDYNDKDKTMDTFDDINTCKILLLLIIFQQKMLFIKINNNCFCLCIILGSNYNTRFKLNKPYNPDLPNKKTSLLTTLNNINTEGM